MDTTSPRRWSIPIAPVSTLLPSRAVSKGICHLMTFSFRPARCVLDTGHRMPSSSFFGLNGLAIHQVVVGSCAEGGGRRKKKGGLNCHGRELRKCEVGGRVRMCFVGSVKYLRTTDFFFFFFFLQCFSSSYSLVDQLYLFFFFFFFFFFPSFLHNQCTYRE